jgi:hypothetical protein
MTDRMPATNFICSNAHLEDLIRDLLSHKILVHGTNRERYKLRWSFGRPSDSAS